MVSAPIFTLGFTDKANAGEITGNGHSLGIEILEVGYFGRT